MGAWNSLIQLKAVVATRMLLRRQTSMNALIPESLRLCFHSSTCASSASPSPLHPAIHACTPSPPHPAIHASTPSCANRFVGTVSWMAPEVIRQDGNVTEKCDIWSYGVVRVMPTAPMAWRVSCPLWHGECRAPYGMESVVSPMAWGVSDSCLVSRGTSQVASVSAYVRMRCTTVLAACMRHARCRFCGSCSHRRFHTTAWSRSLSATWCVHACVRETLCMHVCVRACVCVCVPVRVCHPALLIQVESLRHDRLRALVRGGGVELSGTCKQTHTHTHTCAHVSCAQVGSQNKLLPIPSTCPGDFATLMRHCWNTAPLVCPPRFSCVSLFIWRYIYTL